MQQTGRKSPSALVITVLFVFVAVCFTRSIACQSLTSATITGKVMDPSGAAIPNVTVTATSPALQVPSVKTTSGSDGSYKLLDLPAPGTYTVSFEANGFQKMIRSGLQLTVGFNSKLDTTMAMGAVTQTVEVSAAGPVIDAVSTVGSSTINKQEIQETPKGLTLQELLPMAAGVSMQGKPDVGDSNLALKTPIITYGVVLEPTLDVEGINTTTAKAADTAVYLASLAMSEVQFKTSGNNAEIAFPGVAMEAQIKSGGNTFHGDVQGDYENPSFQGNNVSSALAAPPNNLTIANPLGGNGYYDYAADLGGRIITDKLWFYGGYSKQQITQGSPSFHGAPNASGCWTCADAKPANIQTWLQEYNGKLSYQLTHSTNLSFTEVWGNKFASATSFSPLRPLPATQYQHQPDDVWVAAAQSTFGPRWLLDGRFGHSGYSVNYTAQPASALAQYGFPHGSNFAGSPSEEELSTKLYTGPNAFIQTKPHFRYEMNITASFIPSQPKLGGTHQLKFGTVEDWETNGTRSAKDSASGDYLLQFQNGVPNKIVVYNYPFPNSLDQLHSQAGFITDLWTIRRVTLNLGIRAESYDSFYPTQSKPAGQFSALFPAQTFQGQDILTWNDIVPRVGAAWDVAGNGKTVLKGSFGIFGDTMGDAFADTFNPNAQQSRTYNWSGPCAPTAADAPVQYACDATPAFLASLPNLTPTSSTGGTSQVLNPNLKQDKTYEYTGEIERQVIPNMAVNFTYVRHVIYNLYDAATNAGSIGQTADSVNDGIDIGHNFNIPVTFTDTFNGVSTPVTVYTYAKGTGKSANEVVNNPSSRPDIYNSFEFGVTKRYSKRWNALASFWTTKNHRWIQGTAGIAGSPNDNPFPIDDTWNWEGRASVVYNAPKAFQISSFYRVQSGIPGQRTSVFNSSALAQGSTTIRMGPYGEFRGPVTGTLNLRVARNFTFHERFRLQPDFQLFNVLNSSGALATNYQTGAKTFGVASSILSPRVARIGALFTF